MLAELLSVVPAWVLLGVVAGGLASVFVAAVFYAGGRIFPDPTTVGPTGNAADGATGDGSDRSGDAKRRKEIRAYLSAIGERVRENHTVSGVTVPFYLPERGVAITFDAHDYFRLEGAGVFTVLCEHEMPGRGLGRRLPFDVDESAFEDASNDRSGTATDRRGYYGAVRNARADAVSDAFDVLGLPRDADADEVRTAYRERVKEVHPDQGGDEESFKRVREAYATASSHAQGDAPAAGPAPAPGSR